MQKNDILKLIGESYERDEIGQHIPVKTSREVFCNISSVSAEEQTAAGQQGFNAEYRATVFEYDYQHEALAEYDGNLYSIYRTYLSRGENIELYLGEKAGD